MYTALLVDDEPWTLQSLAMLFPWKTYNFELLDAVSDSDTAMDLLIKKLPDIVFTDVNMPGISGLELMNQAQKRNLETKFVIISAHSDFRYAQEAIRNGALDYLLKPITEDDAINVLIKLQKHLDEKYAVSLHTPTAHVSISNPSFAQMLSYIDANYMEKLSLHTVSELFGLSDSYCCQLFQKYFNCSFFEYIINLKMNQAAKLLLEGKSTQEIAGFLNYDYSHFNKSFKKYFGVTPYEYKKGRRK